MINFDLIPFTSLNEIHARQDRASVRNILNSDYEEFVKSPLSEAPTDDMLDMDIHVFYDRRLLCKGVEVFAPNNVVVFDLNLLGSPFSELKEQIENQGYNVELTDCGFDCEDLGVSLFCPDYDENDRAIAESVYIRFKNE